ncbi:MAG: hypothetical protein HYW86_00590 [Candidatus Roizmanbacteria bacterium]|nr:MAG: hypothetical protein HYW86_00590 [Candidatus Roizmanbacteria bacterium]
MRKIIFIIFITFITIITVINISTAVWAKESIKVELDPTPCQGGVDCPASIKSIYQSRGETCVATFDEFKQNPAQSHFWAEDPEVKIQGQSNERARQFISWVLNKNAIDDHPTIKSVWNTTRNISYFFVVLLAAILGIGFIISQRTSFDFKIKIWPSVLKIAGALFFITFSAAIVLFLIQLSEIMMKFFMENLGGKDLFNIYFASSTSQESNYLQTPGCRDLNFGVQEAAQTELFMMKLTNITYYLMGVMILLRKIILWFLLFISPFLAILLPFVFIRNIGWVWIGVFFQWLFYGPLFALFLGGLARIWREGIPFIFDFQRAGNPDGYIYPTAISILYGGPAQSLSVLNNGNYIDTFVEYVITLLMLWVAIFLPWLLLRIFRDYCCDGINAMKNILLSLYDQKRNGPTPPSPTSPSTPSSFGAKLKMTEEMNIPVKVKLETLEEIKKTKTEEITKSLNLSATKLTDIARIETNKQTQQTIRQNMDYLSNPTKAQTPVERQKYMNIRTELFNRAIKEDTLAKQILSTTSASTVERMQNREKILQTTLKLTPVTQVVSYKVKLPTEKVSSITASLADTITSQTNVVNSIAQNAHVSTSQVQTVIASYKQNSQKPSTQVIQNITQETGLQKEQVVKVVKQMAEAISQNKELVKQVAQKEQITEDQVEKVVQAQTPLIAEPEMNIEQTVAIPSTISIEDYEEVKKMWIQQYEKGEVPVTENLTNREQWIDQDIVFITNTLNKLISDNPELKNQGLDEIGYILPIFMINNLKGDELLVYLKAKLEAAKTVQGQIDKEKEITEKLQSKAEEVLVDVPLAKKEEASKTMTMAEELKIDEEKDKLKEPEPKKEEEKTNNNQTDNSS